MAAGHGRRLARLVLLPGLPLLLGRYALAKPCLLRPAASRCRRSCPGVPNKPGHRGGQRQETALAFVLMALRTPVAFLGQFGSPWFVSETVKLSPK